MPAEVSSSQLVDDWIFRNNAKSRPRTRGVQDLQVETPSRPWRGAPPAAPNSRQKQSLESLPIYSKAVVNVDSSPVLRKTLPVEKHTPESANRRPYVFATASPLRSLRTIIKTLTTAAVGAFLALAWWALLRSNPHSLTTAHSDLETSIQHLRDASIILTSCNSFPQTRSGTTTSLSETIVLLDRDVRNAADSAIDCLSEIHRMIPTRDSDLRHGLSCLRAAQIAAKLRDTADRCFQVTRQHEKALDHSRNITSRLQEAIEGTKLERERLHALRMTKHRGAFEQAKELIGLSSDHSHDKTLEEYNKQTTTINVLANARSHTVSCVNLQDTERALWYSVGNDLQLIRADFLGKLDIAKSVETCVSPHDYAQMAQKFGGAVRKVIS